MSLQGHLRDMNVAELIQHICDEGKTARLQIEPAGDGEQASLFIEKGRLVHAQMGASKGEEVAYAILGWQDGTFQVEPDVVPPEWTIERSHTALLLEGMRRLDEQRGSDEAEPARMKPEAASAPGAGAPLASPDGLAAALKRIAGVEDAVVAGSDGIVLAHEGEGNPEKQAAAAVFVGHTADQVGGLLALGASQWSTVALGKETVLVLKRHEYYLGLVLAERASPAFVASQALAVLG
ncbi:MAG: DUF4388 domain-containing protein [Anaerolineales bacterium]